VGVTDLTLPPLESSSTWLVRRAKSGDREAFDALLAQHERAVLRTALRLVGRLDLAQDAAQEVFLRLHKYLARFDDERELGPWLYRMVVNVCHDLRRGHVTATVPLEDVEEPAANQGSPDEMETRLDHERRRRVVARALETLPEKERAALVLRDIEGLATSEVARILGSSEATVRSQVSTARVKLKQVVDRWRKKQP
jgi:RNA polymerase sigma-70 factor (ECF subfamily)